MEMKRWILASVAFLATLLLAFLFLVRERNSKEPILVYCGAGIKDPVEAAAKRFEAETECLVRLQFGPSQALLAQAEISRQGSLYLPGDDSFVEIARSKGLATRSIAIASMAPVLAVQKGNPKGIRSIDDLLRQDIKLGQVNPDAAAAGKLVREALRKHGRWEAVAGRTTLYAGTVNEVAVSLRLGSVDAGFVWDVLVKPFPELEIVPIPELAGVKAHVTAALLRGGETNAAAWRFAEYLAAPAGGLKFFRQFGFEPSAVDSEAPSPAKSP